MTTFRLWTTTNSDGLPTRGASSDWWHWCRECHHLTRLRPDPDQYDEPKAPAVDYGGAPDHIAQLAADVAASHECVRRVPPKPKPRYKPTPPVRRARVWTAAEDELIRQLPLKEAAKAVGAHRTTVAIRRRELGLVRKLRTWTAAEDEIVTGLSVREAAERLGMTERAIRSRREQLARKARARAAA